MVHILRSSLTRNILSAFLLCSIIFPAATYGQQPDVRFRIYVRLRDSSGTLRTSTAFFGVHSTASYCIDTALYGFTDNWFEVSPNRGVDGSFSTEFSSYPPCPPIQELRIRNVSTSVCTDYGYSTFLGARPVNIHNFQDTLQVDTFRISWCAMITGDANAPKQIFSWPSPTALQKYCDSMFFLTNTNIKVNMLTQPRYVYDPALDTNASFGSARIFIYHPKKPPLPPDTVIRLYPPNGATSVSQTDSLTWMLPGDFPEAYYRVELSTDSKFQHVIARDSSLHAAFPLGGIVSPNT